MAELHLSPGEAAALGLGKVGAKRGTKTGRSRVVCDMRCTTCSEVVRVPGVGPVPHMKENPTHRRYECVLEQKGT